MRFRPQIITLAAVLCASPVFAGDGLDKFCGWRPSQLIGGAAAGALGTAGTAVSAAGVAANAAGFYTLTNAVTGLTMLGSTAGGVSAAGTVGIMGGTAGAIGSVAAALMAPVTIIAGAVLAVTIGGTEAVCFFNDERITDPDEVLAIVRNISDHSDPTVFIAWNDATAETWLVRVRGLDGYHLYRAENLYLVNGELKHDGGIGKKTTIGKLGYVTPTEP